MRLKNGLESSIISKSAKTVPPTGALDPVRASGQASGYSAAQCRQAPCKNIKGRQAGFDTYELPEKSKKEVIERKTFYYVPEGKGAQEVNIHPTLTPITHSISVWVPWVDTSEDWQEAYCIEAQIPVLWRQPF